MGNGPWECEHCGGRAVKDGLELERLRRSSVAYFVERGRLEPIKFTCDGCAAAPECPYAFDVYNTHGDCLAEK